MNRTITIIKNENGSIILVSMIVLVMLTLFGMSAMTTSTIELQISGNEASYKETFYSAESGWNLAAAWLDDQFPLPTTDMVLQFSAGAGVVSYTDTTGESSDSMSMDGGNSFQTAIVFGGATRAEGYSTDFKRYVYDITSTASGVRNTQVQLIVGAGKVELVN